jgi:hypothetical protein
MPGRRSNRAALTTRIGVLEGDLMNRIGAGLAALGLGQVVMAGPIAQEFHSGYEGVGWDTTLTTVVAAIPGGDHYFAPEPGARIYSVRSDTDLFDIPRRAMTVEYCFTPEGRLNTVGVALRFEQREQLLGTLTSLFGPYREVSERFAILYVWPRDHEVSISVRASRDPVNGILEFWIHHYPP